MKNLTFVIILSVGFLNLSCKNDTNENVNRNKQEEKMKIKVESSAFNEGEMIPSKFTCTGDNISPQIRWEKPSEKTKSFTLIVDDPDAPGKGFVHWVVFNIPADKTEISENESLSDNIIIGRNGSGNNSYTGPCPPSGTHRYFFKIYALDTMLDANDKINKDELLNKMQGHIISSGQLMGKFSK